MNCLKSKKYKFASPLFAWKVLRNQKYFYTFYIAKNSNNMNYHKDKSIMYVTWHVIYKITQRMRDLRIILEQSRVNKYLLLTIQLPFRCPDV